MNLTCPSFSPLFPAMPRHDRLERSDLSGDSPLEATQRALGGLRRNITLFQSQQPQQKPQRIPIVRDNEEAPPEEERDRSLSIVVAAVVLLGALGTWRGRSVNAFRTDLYKKIDELPKATAEERAAAKAYVEGSGLLTFLKDVVSDGKKRQALMDIVNTARTSKMSIWEAARINPTPFGTALVDKLQARKTATESPPTDVEAQAKQFNDAVRAVARRIGIETAAGRILTKPFITSPVLDRDRSVPERRAEKRRDMIRDALLDDGIKPSDLAGDDPYTALVRRVVVDRWFSTDDKKNAKIRAIVDEWSKDTVPEQTSEMRSFDVSQAKAGSIVILRTQSGSVYVLSVVDPAEGKILIYKQGENVVRACNMVPKVAISVGSRVELFDGPRDWYLGRPVLSSIAQIELPDATRRDEVSRVFQRSSDQPTGITLDPLPPLAPEGTGDTKQLRLSPISANLRRILAGAASDRPTAIRSLLDDPNLTFYQPQLREIADKSTGLESKRICLALLYGLDAGPDKAMRYYAALKVATTKESMTAATLENGAIEGVSSYAESKPLVDRMIADGVIGPWNGASHPVIVRHVQGSTEPIPVANVLSGSTSGATGTSGLSIDGSLSSNDASSSVPTSVSGESSNTEGTIRRRK